MTTISLSRQQQLSPGLAIKTPCKAASIAALTLSGEQTIDGVACIEDDRVLVKDQVSTVGNGVYLVSTGDWSRAPDFDGNRDVVTGTIVTVNGGSINANTLWRVTTSNPVIFGTSLIAFTPNASSATDSSNISFTQAGIGAVTRTVQAKERDIVSVLDFIPVALHADISAGTNATTLTAYIQAAFDAGAGMVIFPNPVGTSDYRIDTNVTVTRDVAVEGNGSTISGAGYLSFEGSAALVGNISAAATKGDSTITVSSVGSFAAQDILEIWDDVDFSWAPFQASYKDGEMQRVLSVGAGTITVAGALESSYANAATSKVYKVSPVRVNVKNLECRSSGISVFSMIYCADSYLENVSAIGGVNQAFVMSSCYNIKGDVLTGICTETPVDLQYGFNLAQSQGITLRRGVAHGRHGVATGNSQRMPMRRLLVEDFDISCPVGWSVAADFHGSTADSKYLNCRIYGGVVLSGENCGYENCTITGKKSLSNPIGYLEPNGGTLFVRNCTVNFAASAGNVVQYIASYAGATSDLMNVDTQLDFSGSKFTVGLASLVELALLSYGGAADLSCYFKDITLVGSLANMTRLIRTNFTSAVPAELHITELKTPDGSWDLANDPIVLVAAGSAPTDVRLPNLFGSFTPTGTFATPGDFATTAGANNAGRWRLQDGILHYALDYNPATFTFGGSASGNFILGGFPIAAAALLDGSGSITFADADVKYTGFTWVTPLVLQGTKTMILIKHATAAASVPATETSFTTTQVPRLQIAGSYRVKPTT